MLADCGYVPAVCTCGLLTGGGWFVIPLGCCVSVLFGRVGTEQYVYDMVVKGELSWFPLERALVLETQEFLTPGHSSGPRPPWEKVFSGTGALSSAAFSPEEQNASPPPQEDPNSPSSSSIEEVPAAELAGRSSDSAPSTNGLGEGQELSSPSSPSSPPSSSPSNRARTPSIPEEQRALLVSVDAEY